MMTIEQRQTLDTIVEAFKKAAKQCEMEIEVSDYDTFIKENPEENQIPIKINVKPPVKYVQITFEVDKNEN